MEMEVHRTPCSSAAAPPASDEEMDLRRGPWTIEEDLLLANYVNKNGEGRWNSLARCAGLKRTGKSCRLRWLNYLRPDVRRGNITPEEQLLILELHSRWGNRWSKIAQHLPGRTDNEIKNYWRTRVQKHAKQLKCDVNSKQFRDVMRYLWMPRLVERIQAAASARPKTVHQNDVPNPAHADRLIDRCDVPGQAIASPDTSSAIGSSSEISLGVRFSPNPVMTVCFMDRPSTHCGPDGTSDTIRADDLDGSWSELLASAGGNDTIGLPDFGFGGFGEDLWSLEDIWLQQQL